MKKILYSLIIICLVSSCKGTGQYFWNDTETHEEKLSKRKLSEENLSEGKIIDYRKHSLYEVTASDSLASIARKYGTTSDTLIAMNNLRKPYILKPGMLIKVPTIRKIGSSSKSVLGKNAATNPKIIQIEPSTKDKILK